MPPPKRPITHTSPPAHPGPAVFHPSLGSARGACLVDPVTGKPVQETDGATFRRLIRAGDYESAQSILDGLVGVDDTLAAELLAWMCDQPMGG